MRLWQSLVLLVYLLINLLVFIKGYYECKFRKNAYGLTRSLFFVGVFAWGDAVVFCPFWMGSVIVNYFLKDWYLFLLLISVFWVVRSFGETIYWFDQQFSQKVLKANIPDKMLGFRIFQNDSIWYIYQIGWQCVTVISTILAIYIAKLWLQ